MTGPRLSYKCNLKKLFLPQVHVKFSHHSRLTQKTVPRSIRLRVCSSPPGTTLRTPSPAPCPASRCSSSSSSESSAALPVSSSVWSSTKNSKKIQESASTNQRKKDQKVGWDSPTSAVAVFSSFSFEKSSKTFIAEKGESHPSSFGTILWSESVLLKFKGHPYTDRKQVESKSSVKWDTLKREQCSKISGFI